MAGERSHGSASAWMPYEGQSSINLKKHQSMDTKLAKTAGQNKSTSVSRVPCASVDVDLQDIEFIVLLTNGKKTLFLRRCRLHRAKASDSM